MSKRAKSYWIILALILYIIGLVVAVFDLFDHVITSSIIASFMVTAGMGILMVLYPISKRNKNDKK